MYRHRYTAGAGERRLKAGRPLERAVRLHHGRPSAAVRENIDRCAGRKRFPENANRGEPAAWHVIAGVYTNRRLSGLGHGILPTKKTTSRYAGAAQQGSGAGWWTSKKSAMRRGRLSKRVGPRLVQQGCEKANG